MYLNLLNAFLLLHNFALTFFPLNDNLFIKSNKTQKAMTRNSNPLFERRELPVGVRQRINSDELAFELLPELSVGADGFSPLQEKDIYRHCRSVRERTVFSVN